MNTGRISLVLLPSLVLLVAVAVSAAAPAISLEERCADQRAIEEAMWRYRVWPKENPAPKPALEKVMPRAAIVAKVENTLRMSNALEQLWGEPITGAQLQSEMERQARDSKQPALLREMWAALGNDPHRIAEVLARPTLVERLLLTRYRENQFGAGKMSFDLWWASIRNGLATTIAEPVHGVEADPANDTRDQREQRDDDVDLLADLEMGKGGHGGGRPCMRRGCPKVEHDDRCLRIS